MSLLPFHSTSVFFFKSLIRIGTLKGICGRGRFFLISRVTTCTASQTRKMSNVGCKPVRVQSIECKGTTLSLRFTNFLSTFFDFFSPLKKKGVKTFHRNLLNDNILLQCCSVAVLKKVFPIPKNTSIFIYKYRVYFDFSYSPVFNCNNCNTTTPYRSLCAYLFDIKYVAMALEDSKYVDFKFEHLFFAAQKHKIWPKSTKIVTFLRLIWLELLSKFSANLRQINVISRQKARILYLISSYFYIIRLDPSSRINCLFKLDKLK